MQWWSSLGCLAKVQHTACKTSGDKIEKPSQAEKLSCRRMSPKQGQTSPATPISFSAAVTRPLWAQGAKLAQERGDELRGLCMEKERFIDVRKKIQMLLLNKSLGKKRKKTRKINLHTTDLMLQYLKIFVACVGLGIFLGGFFCVF